MVKKVLSIFSLLFLMSSANAAREYMTVELENGSKYNFLLVENPVITYNQGQFEVNGSATTTYSLSNIKNYHFSEGDEAGVDHTIQATLRIVNLDESTLEVHGAEVGTHVVLTATNGTTLFSGEAQQDGNVRVNLPSTKGIYVLTVGHQSFKIIRK